MVFDTAGGRGVVSRDPNCEKNAKKKRSDAAVAMDGADCGHGLGASENNNGID